MIKRIIHYIAENFFLRNLVFAICGIIVFLFFVNLLLSLFTRHGQRLIVPEFVGLTLSEAEPLCSDADLELVIIDSLYLPGRPAGSILDQSPDPKMTVKSGRKVFVVINSERPRMDYIPYVAGYSLRQAKNMLETRGFQISKIIYTPDIATNNVLNQRYKATPITGPKQIKAELGQGITLTVGQSGNTPLPIVPKVIGLTLREAKSRIWEMGLNIGEVKPDRSMEGQDPEKGRVYRQTPNQQMRANFGSPVTLYTTLESSKVNEGGKLSDSDARNFVEVDTTRNPTDEILKELGISRI